MNVSNRTVFEGDNLDILRGIDSKTVDLICLDPPFNSNRTYEAPIGSKAAGAAFKDAWTLNDLDNAWHGELAEVGPALYSAISVAGETHGPSMKAYLIMMSIRMLELHRVLKPTGSIYLHCDPNASHYLKTMMDSIFGQQYFRAEIIWKRHNAHNDKLYGTIHDTIFHYSYKNRAIPKEVRNDLTDDRIEAYDGQDEHGKWEKGDLKASGASNGESGRPWRGIDPRGIDPKDRHWAPPKIGSRGEYAKYIQKHFIPNYGEIEGVHARLDALDEVGLIHWPDKENGVPRLKRYLTDIGQPPQSIIDDIPLEDDEDLGFKTQKPIALYELFIQASSNRGDVVLDPFCGCATTCIAAEKHQRQWIGIDISHKAVDLVKIRLEKEFNLTEYPNLLGQVVHRTTPPQRTDPIEPQQIHREGLFGVKDASILGILSQQELRRFKTYKHVLFGMQEGKCAGCKSEYPFRNLTIDHKDPRSKGGSDHLKNLQLLCNWCNSVKGDRSQAYLNKRLTEEGILR